VLDYDALSRRPAALRALTGLGPDDFEALLVDFATAQDRRRRAAARTRAGTPRRRAYGAGRKPDLDDRHRLLLTLVWLKVYPTYELLGTLFGLHKRNAQLNARDVVATLAEMGDFPFERPPGDRERLSSVAAVMDAFPQVRLVIDAKEQRVERPRGEGRQKPFSSGKKRCHTLKTQVAVRPDGSIGAVSDSVPGGAWHDLTLLRSSGLLWRLDAGADEGAMLDKGYVGVRKDRPDLPLFLPHRASRGHPLTAEQREENRAIARYRIVVEHTIAQLARFGALRQVWRSTIERHGRAFRAVAALVDRRIRAVPLKRYAAA
jgi:DDE superfamily endonuclease/Helix-turn-helix of DDE superfamily endonuclease